MRRVKRLRSNLLPGLSLGLCLAMVALWAQSWIRPIGGVTYHTPPAGAGGFVHASTFYSKWGRVQWSSGRATFAPATLVGFFRDANWRPDISHPWRALGLYVEHDRRPPPVMRDYWYVSFPHWLAVAVLAPFPLLHLAAARRDRLRRHRLDHGLCLRCGYDLRANTGRCPECGTDAGATPTPPPGATPARA